MLNINSDHCHPCEPEEIQIRKFKEAVKIRAINETTPIPQIYDEEATRINLSTLSIASLLSRREISSTLNRARRLQAPHIPDSQIITLDFQSTFVCVLALLPDKKKPTYKLLFHELRNKLAQFFHPNTIVSDFEETLANIIKSEFSNSLHVRCYFHYTQAIYRNIQRLRLSSEYAADEEIRNTYRKIMALALMPVSLVLRAFGDLSESVLESSPIKFNLLKPLFHYFENQWLKNVDIQRWNVYGLKLRTNDNCEGYHNRLNLRISKYHPNSWAFIRCIQGGENRFNHLLIQLKGDVQMRPKTKKTQPIRQRIDTLYIRHDNVDATNNELLEGLSLSS
ncbi:unnamed protein product [Rotaria socialis]|uniref:MULE transposase domain-containing protein n=3 Tax=Rotaria socialis TaxID=392032 RepID=A0A821WDN7_9BILA|nr:unnamed protein product [Rotaria socialis]